MSKIQSVIFNKSHWNVTNARKWLKTHNLKPIKAVDRTTNTLRFRIRQPGNFSSFIIKSTDKNISLVIGFRKRKRKRKIKRVSRV